MVFKKKERYSVSGDPLRGIDLKDKHVALISLGCARNTVDSEVFLKRAREHKAIITSPQKARVVLVNTCGFTQQAKEESLSVIMDLLDRKSQGRLDEVVILGCLAKRYHDELRRDLGEARVVPRLADFKHKGDFLTPGERLTPRHTAYLKIAEGCDNCCTYCAIPLIKGPLRSRPQKEIIREARALDRQGVKEINIIGQDITLYGSDRARASKGLGPLISLLKSILKETSVPWVRLLYLHPDRIHEDLVGLMAQEERIVPYLDLPLQHVSERILKRMGRTQNKEQVRRTLSSLRSRRPDIALRTTFIVGFPSETKEEFQELLDFITQVRFDKLGAFMYSREEGTRAYAFKGQIKEIEKQRRYDALLTRQRGISRRLLEGKIGRQTDVLVEEKTQGSRVYLARTPQDAPEVDGLVTLTSSRKLSAGEIVRCRITDSFEYDLAAEVL